MDRCPIRRSDRWRKADSDYVTLSERWKRRRRIRKSGSADSEIVFVNSLTGYSGEEGEVNSNRDGFVTGNSPLLLICM